jgi:hypothetical protein
VGTSPTCGFGSLSIWHARFPPPGSSDIGIRRPVSRRRLPFGGVGVIFALHARRSFCPLVECLTAPADEGKGCRHRSRNGPSRYDPARRAAFAKRRDAVCNCRSTSRSSTPTSSSSSTASASSASRLTRSSSDPERDDSELRSRAIGYLGQGTEAAGRTVQPGQSTERGTERARRNSRSCEPAATLP